MFLEQKEKIIRRVKEVLAQRPDKAKKPIVIVICHRGKKKTSRSQVEKKEEALDHSSIPNNTQ